MVDTILLVGAEAARLLLAGIRGGSMGDVKCQDSVQANGSTDDTVAIHSALTATGAADGRNSPIAADRIALIHRLHSCHRYGLFYLQRAAIYRIFGICVWILDAAQALGAYPHLLA
jgi:hypothetical protein